MYFQNESDETLVMLTLAGEQTAYEALVIRYQNAVMASAIAVTKNHFMAEDAAQDAFVTAWMKLDTLQEPKKYGSWVCRIAKNCALNMVSRYSSFLPLDVVENLNMTDDGAEDPAELYARTEERDEVNKGIAMLPEKVQMVIRLHYFEDLSVAQIADRMRISEGTVKRQLHDGRKRIRKELCAMNEKYSDTLVQRVMKKVEELKLWQTQNDKSGFEKVYAKVLREVEKLPECTEKHHALADVLMRGWWWLPGQKNDAMFARIREAAVEGRNDEVMEFIVTREDSRVYGSANKIEFIRNTQIPRLEKTGFIKTLGREWFWLGYYLFRENRQEEALAAYKKVEEILSPGDAYHALVPLARNMEKALATRYKDTVPEHYTIGGRAEEYRRIDGSAHYWEEESFGEGELGSIDQDGARILHNASCCDGFFFADVPLGGSYVGSDGTTLTYASEHETVDTPAGRFDDCRLWEVRRFDDTQKTLCKTFYKDGIGIVRQDHITDGTTDTHLLATYEICGGSGLLPLFPGNTWSYHDTYSPDALRSELNITVSYADHERMLVSTWKDIERHGYDADSWSDTIQEIANEYCHSDKNGSVHICDVYPVIERAERLAVTPMEKAHTKAAASVARRILSTDPAFNPNYTATGHWNFFNRNYIQKRPGRLFLTSYDPRWSFEWKGVNDGATAQPILFNDILGILQDATNCIWSDEWCIGASPIIEYNLWDRAVKTQITCEDGGRITTRAGTFEHCFKLCLDIGGMDGGWSYRGGKKVYYFADGIGIVRTENEYCNGAKTAVYELTSYEGTGEGYMPLADGLMRRYDALNLTDGYVGAVEYAYVADEDGDIVVFADRVGIRELPPPMTQYSSIQGEMIASALWDAGKHQEAQMKYGANMFHLILHLLACPSFNRGDAKRSVAINGFNLKLLELLSGTGEIPPAWYGLYSWRSVVWAAALFGDGQREEGYRALESAVEYCEKIADLKEGDLLEIGDPYLFGGAKLIWGKDVILCADGSMEPVDYEWTLHYNGENLFYALTAPHGWEWFDSVRDEERFKACVDRVGRIVGLW